MEHTEWRAIRGIEKTEKGWFVVDAAGMPITGWGSVTQTEAIARLIAAAPKLLFACRALCKILPDSVEFDEEMWPEAVEAWDNALTVIAEATGE